MTVICLCGRAGSGKDTAADILLDNYLDACETERYALAKPIKELAKEWLGWKDYHVERMGVFDREAPIYIPLNDKFYCLDILIYDKFKDHPLVTPELARLTSRSIISSITEEDGANILRNKDESEIVLKTTPRKVLQVIGTEGFRDTICKNFWLDCAPKDNVVITDVRFPNELEYFREQDALILHITRDGVEGVSKHESEQDLEQDYSNPTEYAIENNGTLQDLHMSLEVIYENNFG